MSENKVVVTDDVRANHPELVQMILETESMNNEERQYWVDLLPIMTPEQIENLYAILDNEKKKLAEIDNYYSQKVEDIEKAEEAERITKERREKMDKLASSEKENEVSEKELEEKLLAELDNL